MERAAVIRLVWKEWRCQQAFLITMLVTSLVAQLSIYLFAVSRGRPLPIEPIFAVACWSAVLYMLGCAATTFASEHESGTYAFQQALPLRPAHLLTAKLGFAAVSTLLLALVVTSTAALLTGGRSPESARGILMARGLAVTGLEIAAWSTLFSLLLKRPLRAALLAIIFQSVVVHALIPTMANMRYLRMEWFERYAEFVVLRTSLALAILAADIVIGQSWLSARPWRLPTVGIPLPRASRPRRAAGPAVWSRLLWLQWQHSKFGIMLLLLGMSLLVASAVVSLWYQQMMGINISAVYLLVPISLISGAMVFEGDQRGSSFRFLAERGVSPTRLWLSRHIIWMAALLVLGGSAIVPVAVLTWAGRVSMGDWWTLLGVATLVTALTYSIGQLCSIYFRSTLVAIAAAAAAAIVCLVWTAACYRLAVNPLIGVAPLPVAFMLASWLRVRDWLLESRTWGSRIRALLGLTLPLCLVLGAVASYRTFEFSSIEPTFIDVSTASEDRLAGEQALQAYESVWQETGFPPTATLRDSQHGPWGITLPHQLTNNPDWASTLEWARGHEELVQKVLPHTLAADVPWRKETETPSSGAIRGIAGLSQLLMWSGIASEQDGDLSAALEKYWAMIRIANQLRRDGNRSFCLMADLVEEAAYRRLPVWAIHPQQTQSALQAALKQLDQLESQRPSGVHQIRAAYLIDRKLLETKSQLYDRPPGSGRQVEFELVRFCVEWMPWELKRAERVTGHIAELQQRRLFELQERLRTDSPLGDWLHAVETDRVADTTPLLRFLTSHQASSGPGYSTLFQETRRRGHKLAFALQIWRHEHGEYPQRLSDLVGLIPSIPTDPILNKPFRLIRRGPRRLSAAHSATHGIPWNQYYWPVAVRQPYITATVPLQAGPLFREVQLNGRRISVPLLPGASFPLPQEGPMPPASSID